MLGVKTTGPEKWAVMDRDWLTRKGSSIMLIGFLILATLGAVWFVVTTHKRERPSSMGLRVPEASAQTSVQYQRLCVALYNRQGLTWRADFRFTEGDNSYNYFSNGQVYIGLFRNPELLSDAKAFVERTCNTRSGTLVPTTLAEADLRAEDSDAFMAKVMAGDPIVEDFEHNDSIAKIVIRCAQPQGTGWMGNREFKSIEDLNVECGPLIADCSHFATEARAQTSFPPPDADPGVD